MSITFNRHEYELVYDVVISNIYPTARRELLRSMTYIRFINNFMVIVRVHPKFMA